MEHSLLLLRKFHTSLNKQYVIDVFTYISLHPNNNIKLSDDDKFKLKRAYVFLSLLQSKLEYDNILEYICECTEDEIKGLFSWTRENLSDEEINIALMKGVINFSKEEIISPRLKRKLKPKVSLVHDPIPENKDLRLKKGSKLKNKIVPVKLAVRNMKDLEQIFNKKL